MSAELVFSPSRTILSNISELSDRESVLAERRICELYELAGEMANAAISLFMDEMDVYEALSLIGDNWRFADYTVHKEALGENIARLRLHFRLDSLMDRAMLCELWLEQLGARGHSIDESAFLYSVSTPESFTYVKNAYSDEAFDVFSQEFSEHRVVYATSLKDALRMVADGEVGYCLLPLEERGTRIPTVAELLFNGDFKINSVTPVFGFDGLADMKYALVSKTFTVPDKKAEDDLYLEIRISEDAQMPLSEALSVAEVYGIGLYRVNTVRFSTEDGERTYYSMVFRDDGKSFAPLLTYLTLFSSSFTPVGIYKNLE